MGNTALPLTTFCGVETWLFEYKEQRILSNSMDAKLYYLYAVSILMYIYMCVYIYIWASLVAQRLKHLPAMWETWVQSLGQEVPLEKETATHSIILAWKIPWTEEPSRLQSMGSQGRQLHGIR